MAADDVAEEIRLPARGLALAGLRWGAGSPVRVLCVHGWLDNAASFAELAPRLAGCDVVALDLPGHGHSQHRGPGVLQHFVEYVADVVAVLDALGWDNAVLLGHSLGAGVMACVAGVVPERVRALLLVEGIAPQPALPGKITESLRAAIEAGQRGAGESAGYAGFPEAIAARRKGFWPLSDAAAQRILARALTVDDGGTLRWHTDPRLRQPSALRLVEPQVTALLAGIRAPALLVGAEQGLFATRDAHAARQGEIAGLVHACLPGGHHLHLEAETSPAVADLLLGFLARHGIA